MSDTRGKFRKRPVIIEAREWDGKFDEEVRVSPGIPGPGLTRCEYCGSFRIDHGWIETLEGGHIVCPGDWVITGIKGEKYPCKPDIFEATYEKIEDEEPRPLLGENQIIENRGGQDVAASPVKADDVTIELWFQGGAIEIGHIPRDLSLLGTIVVSRHDESRGGISRNYRMRRFPPDCVPRAPGGEPRIVFQEIIGDEPGPEEPGVPWS